MTFRFWRRIRLAPGVTLNLSKSMASLSLGPRGAKYTISPNGNRMTAGLTGTGLFYTVHDRKRAGRDGAAPAPAVERQPPCPRATTILAGFQATEVGVSFNVSG